MGRDQLTKDDIKVYAAVSHKVDAFPNVSKWYHCVSSQLAARFVFFPSFFVVLVFVFTWVSSVLPFNCFSEKITPCIIFACCLALVWLISIPTIFNNYRKPRSETCNVSFGLCSWFSMSERVATYRIELRSSQVPKLVRLICPFMGPPP